MKKLPGPKRPFKSKRNGENMRVTEHIYNDSQEITLESPGAEIVSASFKETALGGSAVHLFVRDTDKIPFKQNRSFVLVKTGQEFKGVYQCPCPATNGDMFHIVEVV